ncbi:MAG TPA: hypothetical protein VFH80_26955 [Solirubrobacteraceae bacterium]|nr:hypothetical protein [Solirubrobacteraceae bacterium]
MTGTTNTPREQPTSGSRNDETPPAMNPAAETTVPFPVLGAPTVVHVSKLSPEAISRCDLGAVEYVVIEPAQGGMRLRPAGIEDQVQYEQEGGLGHVTYSLGEFLDEFTNAPSHPAPTFERLAQFKRDYATLTQSERQLFRAAVKKFVSPLGTTPPSDPGETQLRELSDHPGFFEMRFGADTRAIYTFGQAVRRGQPHVIWCRIGTGDTLEQPPAFCNPND